MNLKQHTELEQLLLMKEKACSKCRRLNYIERRKANKYYRILEELTDIKKRTKDAERELVEIEMQIKEVTGDIKKITKTKIKTIVTVKEISILEIEDFVKNMNKEDMEKLLGRLT